MPMYVRAIDVSKSFGDRLVLSGASFLVNAGERVAIVGPNGCGKTTLLRIVAGLERPDAGSVEVSPPTARLGYLPQQPDLAQPVTVAESLGPAGLAWALGNSLAMAADRVATNSEDTTALNEYGRLWERFEQAGGYPAVQALEEALWGLGLAGLTPDTPTSALSGGMRTRLSLAGLLASRPDVLLLDEPTNHLDIASMEWLEGFVCTYRGAVLVVSHDRAFLDRVAQRLLEPDPGTGALNSYVGGYSEYVAAKEREVDAQWEAYRRQHERVARLEEGIRAAESRARGIEQGTVHFYYRARARKVARSVVARKRRLQRELDREGKAEKPVQGWSLKADFSPGAESGRQVLVVSNLRVSYGEQCVLSGLDLYLRRGERVVITGANGSGKTTLLRAIQGEIVPTGGSIRLGAGVVLGYFAQEHDTLDFTKTPLEVVREAATFDETEARRFLHRFLFAGGDAFVPLGKLSYGERARLMVAQLILSGANCLLLDEPLSHLDIPSRERFEEALLAFDGTVLAVLHDRYAIARLATRVMRLVGGRLTEA